jgi:hypothetical protein
MRWRKRGKERDREERKESKGEENVRGKEKGG